MPDTPNPGHPVGLRYADRLQQAEKARTAALNVLGGGESLALTSLLGPMGEGPEWPAGPAWRALRRDGRLLIFSDGLSDPYVERERPETGLGLEVYIDSPDSGLPEAAPLDGAADTWLFPMIAEVSHVLAGHHRLRDLLLGEGLLSLEFTIDHLKDGRGRLGALLNLPADDVPATIPLPGGAVRLVAVTLLTPEELSFLRSLGASGRTELAARLKAAGIGHRSLARRDSVVQGAANAQAPLPQD